MSRKIPEVERVALDALKAGYSAAEVAELAGRSLSWVKRVDADNRVATMRRKGIGRPRKPAPPDDADDAAADPPAPPEDGSALGTLRAVVATLREALADAQRNGDVRSAQHTARTLSTALPNLARLERTAQDDSDTIRISRAELTAARARYRERVAAVVARPLTCARCGAALRAELAGVELQPEPPAAPDPPKP